MNNIVISLDETHHLKDGEPLYSHRFESVQSFHFPPNYAPVINHNKAFFIDHTGKKVFKRCFKKAFGFYCGIATVVDEQGFFHINEQGQDIHSQRFFWSGNFQENACVVEDKDSKKFFHINPQGSALYKKQYAYVGDYRYGVAVITNDKGLCTHINKQGELLHGHYFLELDIYHKGYAIAKDEQGYFHINKEGKAVYMVRYLKLEPFYNNRAVAIDLYGVKKIISISGEVVHVIENNKTETKKIENHYTNQAFSYWSSRILNSILELGFFDLIKSRISVKNLYQQLDLPEKSIDMILRWLRIQQLITRQDDYICLTFVGEIIAKTVKPIIAYWQSDELISTSLKLTESLKKHQAHFSSLYSQPFFEYTKTNKQLHANLIKIMSYYADDYQYYLSHLALTNEVVCDIGGGNGVLLNTLKSYYSQIKPILLDKFIYNSVQIEYIKGDIFQKWAVSADVYLISRILHDWNDEQVIQLLGYVADNMSNKSILYIFETLIDDNKPVDKGITVSFHLLNLLGGRERTLTEFKTLFQKSGLYIEAVYSENSSISLMKVIKK